MISVVLVGLPNAGKSSLFNALLGDQRAIVSDLAGTTRDAITRRLDLRDLTVELTDTAGLEELQEDSPRATAQTVLSSRQAAAEAILLCIDLSQPIDDAWVREQLACLSSYARTLLVGTKRDAMLSPPKLSLDLMVSAHDAQSIRHLKEQLTRILDESQQSFRSQALHDTMVRCQQSLDLALASLERAIDIVAENLGEELVAAELRAAIDDLSSIIGEVHTEDILDQIFSRFCIGK